MASADRSIGELLTDLTFNLRTLMRQELALARAELTRSATEAKRGAIMIGAGAALAWAGGLTVVAAMCFTLVALGLSPVAATFIVGGSLLIGGYLCIRSGLSGFSADRVAPKATVATLKENAQVLKGHMR